MSNFHYGDLHSCTYRVLYLLYLISTMGVKPYPPFPLSLRLLSLPSLSFPLLPFISLEVGPLNSSYRGSGERCELPSGVWGAPAEIEFGAF